MSAQRNQEFDAKLADLLAEYDEQLANDSAETLHDAATPHELDERIQAARELVRHLRLLWRTTPTNLSETPLPSNLLPNLSADSGSCDLVKFGRFAIERELGRGGFGVVYLGWDPKRQVKVALKVPRLDAFLDPDLRRRFRAEAKAALELQHPNILSALEVTEVGALCCIVSPYSEGKTLEAVLRDRATLMPLSPAIQMLIELAEALAFAHHHGILHRDLKPGNILLDADAELPDGKLRLRPRIMDFGLAKVMAAPGTRTDSQVLIGTLPYISPEQAGEPDALCPASDLFALGVVMYEVLTGTKPFVAATGLATLQNICMAEPTPPRKLRPEIPPVLERICLRCLEKTPADRYGSGAELADDLRKVQRGESIASRHSWSRKIGRWLRTPDPARRAGTYVATHGLMLAFWCVTMIGLSLRVPAEVNGMPQPSFAAPLALLAWLVPLAFAGRQLASRASRPWARLCTLLSVGYLCQFASLQFLGFFAHDLLDGSPHLCFEVLAWVLAAGQLLICLLALISMRFRPVSKRRADSSLSA
jgi:serine/threonine protein kinase